MNESDGNPYCSHACYSRKVENAIVRRQSGVANQALRSSWRISLTFTVLSTLSADTAIHLSHPNQSQFP